MIKTKVLCVEDEIDVRESMVGILESEDFEVFQARDGAQALEVFLETNPDIVISDIMMPDMNGYDLLKSIRENKTIQNNNVPFIFISALGQKEDIIKGINLEASDYLVKPIDFDVLIAKIREKTNGVKKTEAAATKNMDNLKSQVSNIVPNEMLQYVDLINQIAAVLRTEIYGPLPHRKYLDDIEKIYINSLKLKTMVNNFLSGAAISNQLDVSDEIISPVQIMEDFTQTLNKKFQSQIEFNADASKLSDIKINRKVLGEAIKKLVGCVFKINDEVKIRITISDDHFNRLVFIFYPKPVIEKSVLDSQIEKAAIAKTLDAQGLGLETTANNDGVSIILSVPNYRVIQKR